MSQIVQTFTQSIQKEYLTGHAVEHAYRPAVKALIETLDPTITAVNDPKRQKVGAPDFILLKGNLPKGFIEAKDITSNLQEEIKRTNQLRYTSLGNVAYTNNLTWLFYHNEIKQAEVTIGHIESGNIIFYASQFEYLESLIRNFLHADTITVKSSKSLAKLMAEKSKNFKAYCLAIIDQPRCTRS